MGLLREVFASTPASFTNPMNEKVGKREPMAAYRFGSLEVRCAGLV